MHEAFKITQPSSALVLGSSSQQSFDEEMSKDIMNQLNMLLLQMNL